jgi:hypothetical protein
MGHRNPWGLGELPVKSRQRKATIESPFSTKLLVRPTEFEEPGFCNSL